MTVSDGSAPTPADRFVQEQAWWVASELCRRDSRLRIAETWPIDGFYHGLDVGEPGSDRHAFMNLNGTIHLHLRQSEAEPITWARVLAAASPHGVVRAIETALGWDGKSADATTPRSLTYRTLSACLTRRLNDRHPWTVADGRTVAGSDIWSDGDPGFLDTFRGARAAVGTGGGAALMRMWVLRRGEQLAALVADDGRLFRRSGPPVHLMGTYRERRHLDDVVQVVLDEADATPKPAGG